jgi:autotransporter-associated beta strand protein
VNGASVSIDDGVGTTSTFSLGAINPSLSGSENLVVGGYNLTAKNPVIVGVNYASMVVVGVLTVDPKVLSLSELGIANVTKVYDGGTNINGLSLNVDPVLSQVIANDLVAVSATGTFVNRMVGNNKSLDINVALVGDDAANYSLSDTRIQSDSSGIYGSISQLPSVTWIGPSNGNWSKSSNWAGGALPDGNNVTQVIIPTGVNVNYDSALVGRTGSLIVNNGTISFTGANDFEFVNAISGAGSINQSGAGLLTLSGNNTFTGSTSINHASLLVASNTALGAGNVISDGGYLGFAPAVILQSLTVNTLNSVTGSTNIYLTTNILSAGAQIYNANVIIRPDAGNSLTIDSASGGSPGNDIRFNAYLDSADSKTNSLVINAGLGKVFIGDSVGSVARLNGLDITGSEIDILADVLTAFSQQYNGPVVIGNNGKEGFLYERFIGINGAAPSLFEGNSIYARTLISEDPSITLNGTINDSNFTNVGLIPNTHALQVAAISFAPSDIPVVNINGVVGNINPLHSMNIQTIKANSSGWFGELSVGDVTTYSDQYYRSYDITLIPKMPDGTTTFTAIRTGASVSFSSFRPSDTAGAVIKLPAISPLTPEASKNTFDAGYFDKLVSLGLNPSLIPVQQELGATVEVGVMFGRMPCDSKTVQQAECR